VSCSNCERRVCMAAAAHRNRRQVLMPDAVCVLAIRAPPSHPTSNPAYHKVSILTVQSLAEAHLLIGPRPGTLDDTRASHPYTDAHIHTQHHTHSPPVTAWRHPGS
jgi:hypothetical protein